MWKFWAGQGRPQSAEHAEARLIAAIAGGDRAAFQSLYRLYFPRLTRFLDRMTRNRGLMEEVVNDTMFVVWQKAGSYDHSAKVPTWVFAIAYRQALKALRAHEEPVEADVEQYCEDPRLQPELALDLLQSQQQVRRALQTLPLEQRAAVCLTYYHDMGYKEIAETMDCPVNTVKTRMFHARQKLKAVLSATVGE